MSIDKGNIIKQIESTKADKGYVVLEESFFANATADEARDIASSYESDTLVKLPQREIQFFEWLKSSDPAVWDDLWANDDLHKPYLVGMSFLPLLVYSTKRGYPICDLLECDNYYFTEHHMQDEESKVMVDTAREMFHDEQVLSIDQLLALEISLGAIDIWHFAYKYKISVEAAKSAVARLVKDDVLVHLTDQEYLAPFIDF